MSKLFSLGSSLRLTRRACWAVPWLAAPAWGRAARPDLPLAMPFPRGGRLDIAAYLVSEKLDGVRAIWDGRQLCFRSGLPVTAPAAFLRRLPAVPLDGELWMGRGRFEAVSACVRRASPDEREWADVRYVVFEMPHQPGDFAARAQALVQCCAVQGWASLQPAAQDRCADLQALYARLASITRAGGEGLVLHRADAPYVGGRTDTLLKLKPLDDDEAVVIGHVAGQGRHRGRLGALAVRRDDGAVFRIGTGFSDAQRDRPPAVGTRVTYTHQGFTASGLPRFPSFLRVREAP